MGNMINNTKRLLRILLNDKITYVGETVINNMSEIIINPINNNNSLNENISISSNLTNFNNQTLFIKNQSVFDTKLLVPLHVIIFVLSVVGNILVLFTLLKNKRMRTVTNVYLLNLAVADLLLSVFCMPFSLVGQVLRRFIFGATMCKLIPYFQAVSVSVAVWTLVAISLERYFAICRPLKSRRWQTRYHASKMIAFVWIASLTWCGPIVVVSTLQTAKRGYKCRELWPSATSEQIFTLFLDVILLLIPLTIMSLAYFMIMEKLWKGLQREIEHNSCQKLLVQRSTSSSSIPDQSPRRKTFSIFTKKQDKTINKICNHNQLQEQQQQQHNCTSSTSNNANGCVKPHPPTTCTYMYCRGFVPVPLDAQSATYIAETPKQSKENSLIVKETTYTFTRPAIRSNYMDRSIEAKRKVIRMLFVIVAEFFICWTPLHIINTWYIFYPKEVYANVGPTGISLIQLLAYISSCTNPITYCFMNRKFRQTFITAIRCNLLCKEPQTLTTTERVRNIVLKKPMTSAENSCNESTLYLGRISSTARSEPDAEDRV